MTRSLEARSNRAGRALAWSGAARATAAARPRGTCVVLAYHEVADDRTHCRGGSTVSSEVFEATIDLVAREYEPVSLDELVAAARGSATLPRRAVHVTFDDGYRGVLDRAVPVLRRHGVPASAFICTAILDGGTFWWDDLCDALRGARRPRLELEWSGQQLDLDVRADHEHACSTIRNLIASGASPHRPQDAVRLVRAALDSGGPGPLPRTLVWDELGELRQGGIAVASHTVTHPRLAALDDGELLSELTVSRRRLEERTGGEVRALAYPYGGRSSFDARTGPAAAAAGYELAFTGLFGVFAPRRALEAPRVPMAPGDGAALVAAKVSGAFPLLYEAAQRVTRRRRR